MAETSRVTGLPAGLSIDAWVEHADGKLYNASSKVYEAYAEANQAQYAVALVPHAVLAGVYVLTLPAEAIGEAGTINYTIRSGEAAAKTDRVIGSETLSASGEVAAPDVPIPSDPDQCTCYLVMRDAHGAKAAGKTLEFRMTVGPKDGGQSYPRAWEDTPASASDGTGLLSVTCVRKATYEFRRDKGPAVTVEVPDAATYQLPEVLGLMRTS